MSDEPRDKETASGSQPDDSSKADATATAGDASTPATGDLTPAELQPAASQKPMWIATLVVLGVFLLIWVLNFTLLVNPAREQYLVPKMQNGDNATAPAQTQPGGGN